MASRMYDPGELLAPKAQAVQLAGSDIPGLGQGAAFRRAHSAGLVAGSEMSFPRPDATV